MKKFYKIFLIALMFIPCICLMSACSCSRTPKLSSISIFAGENNTITSTYGEEIDLSTRIIVKANYDNNTNETLSYGENGYSYSIKDSSEQSVMLSSSTNVGNYVVTVSYGDFSEECLLKIEKKSITKITTIEDSEYSGALLTANIENNSAYMVSNNTRTNVGSQNVSISLNDKNNYQWSDGTTDDLLLPWTINVLKLTKPTLVGNFPYNTNSQTPVITGYNSTYINQIGCIEAINVGEYTGIFQLKDTTNCAWSDNSTSNISLVWNITSIDPTYSVPTNLEAGVGDLLSSVTLPTVANGQWTWKTPTDVVGAEGQRSHLATFTPSNTTNYNTINNISITITIAKQTPQYGTLPSSMNATYNDTISSLNSQLPSDNLTNGEWAFELPNAKVGSAGTHSIKAIFTPSDTTTYRTVTVDIDVIVAPMPVTKPTLIGTYKYTGSQITANLSNFASDIMDISGNKQTNANTTGHSIVVSLKDKTNYVWSGSNSNDITINWIIAKAIRTFTGLMDISKTYDGNSTRPIVTMTFGDGDISIQYAKQSAPTEYQTQQYIAVGNYKYKVSVAESTNFKAFSFEQNFTISKFNNNTINSISIDDWTYLDTAKTPSATATFGGIYYSYSNLEDGTYSSSVPTTAGTWWLKAYVNDTTNYNSCSRKISFKINKKEIAVPTISNIPYTYTGSEQTCTLGGSYNSDIMQLSNYKRTNAGSQNVQIQLTDTNYKWEGTENGIVTVSWTINKANFITTSVEITAYSNQTLGDVKSKLDSSSGTWAWVLPATTSVGSAGVNMFEATFTPNDNTNYSVQTIDVTITVTQATLTNIALKSGLTYKTDYMTGETLDTTNMILVPTYNYGVGEEINLTSTMVTNFSTSSAVANAKATITYKGKTCNFVYNVAEAVGLYLENYDGNGGVRFIAKTAGNTITSNDLYSNVPSVEGKVLSHYSETANSLALFDVEDSNVNVFTTTKYLYANWYDDCGLSYEGSQITSSTKSTDVVFVAPYYLGNTVMELSDSLFSEDSSIKGLIFYSLDLAKQIAEIPNCAFKNATNFGAYGYLNEEGELKDYLYNNQNLITWFGNESFINTKISKVYFTDYCTMIGKSAFADIRLSYIGFNSTQRETTSLSIGDYAFANALRAWGCLGSGTSYSNDKAYIFSYDKQTKALVINEDTTIYKQLNNASRKIIIPNSEAGVYIGNCAFLIDTKSISSQTNDVFNTWVYSISLPYNLKSIGEGAFSLGGLRYLLARDVDDIEMSATTNNGYSYTIDYDSEYKGTSTLYYNKSVSEKVLIVHLACLDDTPSYTITNGTTRIGDYAFFMAGASTYYNSTMQTSRSGVAQTFVSIIIPSSVTSIGKSAFFMSYDGYEKIVFNGNAPEFKGVNATGDDNDFGTEENPYLPVLKEYLFSADFNVQICVSDNTVKTTLQTALNAIPNQTGKTYSDWVVLVS